MAFRHANHYTIQHGANFFFVYLPSPNLGLTPPRLTTQMPVGQLPVGGATVFGPEHWTDTQGRGLPECVVRTMSGPPSETTQDKTQTKDTYPIPEQKLKFLTPPRIEHGPPLWKAGPLLTILRRRTRNQLIRSY